MTRPVGSLPVTHSLPYSLGEELSDVEMPDAPTAIDTARKAEGLKRKIRDEEEKPPAAKKAKYAPLPSTPALGIPEQKKAEQKSREYAAWVSEDTNVLMKERPQHKSAPNPYRSVHLEVVTGIDEKTGLEQLTPFEIPLVALTNLSPHLKEVFTKQMVEGLSQTMRWKAPGENPVIHKQAAIHIVEFAHFKCGAFEKNTCRSIRQLKQEFPKEFDAIFYDIVRVCDYSEIHDLLELCKEFVVEECREDPSTKVQEYFELADADPHNRALFKSALQTLAADSEQRQRIYPAFVAIFQADYPECPASQKLSWQRFARDCFFMILPDDPEDEELLDIFSYVADLFPHFDFSERQMVQLAEFAFSPGFLAIINLDPRLKSKEDSVIVSEFCKRAGSIIYEWNPVQIISLGWSKFGFEEKFTRYNSLLNLLQRREPFEITRIDQFISAHPDNIFARKMRIVSQFRDINGCLRDVETALESCPDDPDLLTLRGEYLFRKGDREAALRDYNRAIAVDPTMILAFVKRSRYHTEMGNLAEAIRDIDQAIAIEKSADLFKRRAWLYYLSGNLNKALQDIERAYHSNVHDVEILLIRGHIKKAMKKFDEALEDLNTACIRSPYSPYPFLVRGSLFEAMGEFQRALQEFGLALVRIETPQPVSHSPRSVLPMHVDQASILLQRGHCYLQMDDPLYASDNFKAILRIDPHHVQALFGLAKSYWMMGEFYAAWDCYIQLIDFDRAAVGAELNEALKHNPDSSGLMALLASYHAEMNNGEEALSLFNRAVEKSFPLTQVRVLRATYHAERGDPEEALADCNLVLLSDDKDPRAWTARARANIKLGKFDVAMLDVKSAIEHSSDDTARTAIFLRIFLSQKLRNLSEMNDLRYHFIDPSTLPMLNREIALSPQDPYLYFLRALYFWNSKNFEQASRAFGEVLRLRPLDPQALVFQAHCALKCNAIDDCFTTLDRALEINPDEVLETIKEIFHPFSRGDFDLLSGYSHLWVGKLVLAVVDFTTGLKNNPEDHHILRLRSKAFRLLGRMEDAWSDCQRLIDLEESDVILADLNEEIEQDPNNRTARILRGQFKMQTGPLDEAISDFTHVLEFAPEDSDAFLFRGKCFQIQGHVDEAWQNFSRALALGREVLNYFNLCEFTYSDNPVPSILKGRYYLQKYDLIRAMRSFEKALQVQPDNPYANRGLQECRRSAWAPVLTEKNL